MSNEEFKHLKRIFKAALEVEPSKRSAYLEEACGGDRALRARIDKLLASDDEGDDFLEIPAVASRSSQELGSHLLGAHIGRYHLVRVLAAGGMGIVYEALQEEPRRRVAVKVMRPDILSKLMVRRFEYEAEILARLAHPGIARVIEAGIGTGEDVLRAPFLVMEYIPDARSLIEHARTNDLTIRKRLALFLQTCDAVHHGHQKGIIHRDLKPGNILVGAGGMAKVIDFGVARVLKIDPALTAVQTQSGQIIGTLQYMSPEQCMGNTDDLDIRSDVYSLGVVLFELLCGDLPYDVRKTTIFEAARIIREKAPDRPGTFDRALRGDLETIILKALEKEVDRRYQSVFDLAMDIRRHLRGEVIWARPAGPVLRLWKQIKRNPVVSAASGVVLTAVGAFLVATPWYMERLTGERNRAHVAEEKALEGAGEAKEQARIADVRFEEIIRLSDIKRLNQLEAEANALWPALPDMMTEMKGWLDRARRLMDRLEVHNRSLDCLRESAQPREDEAGESKNDPSRSWIFENHKDQWRYDILQDLVEGMNRFSDEDSGIMKSVEDRLAFASTVEARTIKEHGEVWKRTIEAIADPDVSPRYRGLRIEAQLGLIPIGQDPDSGLFEFAHLQTGGAPGRNPDERLELQEGSGLVFVLLPGGSFDMGAVKPTPEEPEGESNIDPSATSAEGPVHRVTIDPFFISKYEMTQGQWVRFTGNNPSKYLAGNWLTGKQITLLHPVEHMTWEECDEIMRRLGLRLPSESEWEYAARAGTSTVWWTGNDRSSLGKGSSGKAAANILDSFAKQHLKSGDRLYEEWLDDGHLYHAPVGTFRANSFGLHEMLGNQWEFCKDSGHSSYDGAPVDGSAWVEEGAIVRVMRGGGFMSPALVCRTAIRVGCQADQRSAEIGVRPALDLRNPE